MSSLAASHWIRLGPDGIKMELYRSLDRQLKSPGPKPLRASKPHKIEA